MPRRPLQSLGCGVAMAERTVAECADDARVTSELTYEARSLAIAAGRSGDPAMWLVQLRQTLMRVDQSITMAGDATETLMHGVLEPTQMSVDDIRAAAAAMQWAANALNHFADARVAEPPPDTNDVVMDGLHETGALSNVG